MADPVYKPIRRRTRTYDTQRDNSPELFPDIYSGLDQLNSGLIATNAEVAGKAPLVHTHVAADITDSTPAGRALLTASNAAEQKTALGLSAVATSGEWSDLSGIPTTVAGLGLTDAVTLTGVETLANKTLILPKYGVATLASLGSAATAGATTEAYISDSSLAHFGNSGSVAVDGGAIILKVYSDGTDWRIS